MTLDEAGKTLIEGGSLPELMEAIGVASNHPQSNVSDLILGLAHPECVAEQAALALYRKTGRPLPPAGSAVSRDPEDWVVWVIQQRRASGPDVRAETGENLTASSPRALLALAAAAMLGSPGSAMVAALLAGVIRNRWTATAAQQSEISESADED